MLDGVTGGSGSLTIPTSGHSFHGQTSYEIVLTATDEDGIQATDSVIVRPEKAPVSLTSSPSGLSLLLDGISRTTPFAQEEIVGFRYAVDAPSPQSGYAFSSWSDGGAAAHTVTVPAGGLSLSATFQHDAARRGSSPPTRSTRAAARRSTDRAGHGHTGTLTGPTWTAAGRNGGGLTFDGDQRQRAHQRPRGARPDHRHDARGVGAADSRSATWRTVVFKEQAAHMTYALYASTEHGAADGSGLRRRPARRARSVGDRERDLDAPRDDLRRQHPAAVRQRRRGALAGGRRGDDGVHRAAEAGRERDLERVVRRH